MLTFHSLLDQIALSAIGGKRERASGQLLSGREIVAYCRGPWCVLSFEAVALLRRHGYPVRRLEDGLPEWKVAGLPVEGAGTA